MRNDSCRSARIPARTHVVGNIKFDFGYPPDIEARGHELRRLLGVHRPVWVAGSTHAKEEDTLIAAHRLVRERFSNALLVLVPRHPPRFAEVAASLKAQEVPFVTRTSGGAVSAEHAGVPAWIRSANLPPFYAAGMWRSWAAAWCPSAATTCSSLPRSACRSWRVPTISIPRTSRTCWWSMARCASCRTRRRWRRSWVTCWPDPTARASMGASGRKAVDDNRGAVARLMQFLEPLLP